MASLVASTSGAGAGAEVTASTDAALTLGDSSSFNCNSKVEVEGDDSNNARGFSSSGPASPTTVILPPSLHYSEDNELNRTHSQPLPSQQLTPKTGSGKENDLAVYYTPSKVFKSSDVADGKSSSSKSELSPTSVIIKAQESGTLHKSIIGNDVAGRTEGFPKAHETCSRNDDEKTSKNSPILNNLSLAQSNVENLLSFDLSRPDGELIPNSFTNAIEDFISSMQQLVPHEKAKMTNMEALIHFFVSVFAKFENKQPKVLIFVLRAFSELAYSTDAPNHKYFDDNVFRHVLLTMKKHDAVLEVQKWGCIALRCFARHAKNTIAIAKAGGIRQIMQSMDMHIGEPSIQVEAFKALFNLAFNAENQKNIVHNNGLSLILKVFQFHQNVREVNEFGCNLLHNLAFKSLTNKQAIAAHGCIEIILNAMKGHFDAPKVQVEACRALMSLAFAGECQDKIAQLGGIETIFSAMKQLQRNKDVQTESCKVLCTLALNHMDNKVIIAQQLDLIIQAMNLHLDSAELLAEGCAVLATLSFRSPKNKLKISKLGGIKAILEAMRKHPKNDEVQIDGCKALASLAFDTSLQRTIASSSGIAVIIGAMKGHLDNWQVQAEACKALSELAYRCTENKKIITECHGATSIVEAMIRHEQSTRVQLEACRALFSQAIRHGSKVIIIESGAVLTVLNAMKLHPKDFSIQDHGCRLLTELMYENSDVKDTVLKNNGVDIILKAVLNHGQSPSVETSDGKAAASKKNASLSNIEERASKALNHFDPNTIFESTCLLLENATTEDETRRAFRLYFFIPQNFMLNLDVCKDSKLIALAQSVSYAFNSNIASSCGVGQPLLFGSGVSASDEDDNNDTKPAENTVSYLTADRVNDWKTKILKIAKNKRTSNANLWTQKTAKVLGQILKLLKYLQRTVTR